MASCQELADQSGANAGGEARPDIVMKTP